MVPESLSNVRPCGIESPHGVAMTRMSGVQNGDFVTPRSHIEKS